MNRIFAFTDGWSAYTHKSSSWTNIISQITGDVTHHTGLDAVEKGIAVIDAGHYGVEKLFVPYMEDYLRRKLPELEILTAPEGEPCHVI